MPRGDDSTGDILYVVGSLPSTLSGRYLCIEPNPSSGARVHSVVLCAGRAASYRQRLISTRAPNGAATTNLIVLAGRVVALADGAIAHELAPHLRASPVDAAGHHLGVGAYPKADHLTGELHLISSPGETTAGHHVISAGGMTRRTHAIPDPPAPVLDLAITTQHLILLADGFIGVADRHCDEPIAWNHSRPTPPGRIVDAHDEGGGVVLRLVGEGLEQWTMNASATLVDRRILDPTPQQPSRLNEQLAGAAHRYLYGVSADRPAPTAGGTTLFKHDVLTGTREDRAFGEGRQAGEFLFVTDPARSHMEDGGWLLGLMSDTATEHSGLLVLDAADVAGPPVASIHLPLRIARTLRGLWVSSPERAP